LEILGGNKMPHLEVWIHLIWTTKNRYPYLKKIFRRQIIHHIRDNAISKGICIDFINGAEDHIHILLRLKADQSIAKIVKLLKGESSYWVNQKKWFKIHFEWQKDYYAISHHTKSVKKIREYIKNQEIHHQLIPYSKELKDSVREDIE
jgi:REP element-mobilizing transposase RayT